MVSLKYREESDEYKHHVATYGAVDKFGYKDFVPMFKAERFDPATWAGFSLRRRGLEAASAGGGTSRRVCDVLGPAV